MIKYDISAGSEQFLDVEAEALPRKRTSYHMIINKKLHEFTVSDVIHTAEVTRLSMNKTQVKVGNPVIVLDERRAS